MKDWIDDPASATTPLALDTNPETPSGAKLRLYRFASLMIVVMPLAVKDKKYLAFQRGLEKRFFPPEPDLVLLEAFKSAMADLRLLLVPEPQPLRWAYRWLADLGIEENDPAKLSTLALAWSDRLLSTGKVLRKFKIVD